MSTLQFELSELSPEQLVALTQAGLIAPSANGNGQAPAPESEAQPKVTAWVNVTGHTCGNRFIAWKTSNGIARHIRGECGCRFSGATCKSLKKGHVTAEQFASNPALEMVEDEQAQQFSFA